MQKLLFIWLSLHLLLGNNLMSELHKIPSMMQHYGDHWIDNKDLSIAEFLVLHYQDAAHLASDEHHQQHDFPFQTDAHQHIAVAASPLFLPQEKTWKQEFTIILPEPLAFFEPTLHYAHQPVDDLIKPPAIAI